MAERYFFGEDDFREQMDTTVAEWRKEHVKKSFIHSGDGTKIACYVMKNPEERATVTIVHGFSEFFGKFHEFAYYLWREGYSVIFFEMRGHGYSGKRIAEHDKVHVHDLSEYVADLYAVTEQVVKPLNTSGKFLMYAHSMGGCVASLYLEQYPGTYQAAVLSSPMLSLNFGKYKNWQVRALEVISTVLGWNTKMAPAQGRYTGEYAYPHCSEMSEVRYRYIYDQRKADWHNQMEGGTYSWVRASLRGMHQAVRDAAGITIPVLLCQAGADTMVKPEGQEEFLKRCQTARKVTFPDSKHEIYDATPEIRAKYFPTVLDFFAAHC